MATLPPRIRLLQRLSLRLVPPSLRRRIPSLRQRWRPAAALTGLAAAAVALGGAPVQAKLSQLSSLYVFGDSLSDSGNSGLLTQSYPGGFFFPPPPYANGRLTNGPVAAEVLWSRFNPSLPPLQPSLAGGTSYALSGATSGLVNFNVLNPGVPPSLQPAFTNLGSASQLSTFLGQSPSFDPTTSLFVLWFFPNDVLFWQSTSALGGLNAGTVLGGPPVAIGTGPAAVPALIQNGIGNISTAIAALAGAGATEFLVPNMPDLGLTPLFRNNPNPAVPAALSALSTAFNTALDPALLQLQASLPGIEIERFQTDDLLAAVLADPASYGFDNVTQACFNGALGTLCPDPDRYLFWDDFHPTAAGHRLIGNSFYGASLAPSPGPVPLAGGASFLFLSRRVRRRIRPVAR